MSVHAKEHLSQIFPKLEVFLDSCSVENELKPSNVGVLEAVVKIVIGQMLSRKAAGTIFNRVKIILDSDPNLLCAKKEDLVALGVSNSKAKTIIGFAAMYSVNPDRFEGWPALSYQELQKEVDSIWGISTWTASMLAIFHFGSEDVFPYQDGTIKKALEKLQSHGVDLDPEEAKPYQSYLALYLWRFIDEKII